MHSYVCECGLRTNWMGDPSSPPKCRRCGKQPSSQELDGLKNRVDRARFGEDEVDPEKNEPTHAFEHHPVAVMEDGTTQPIGEGESVAPDFTPTKKTPKKR